MAFSNFPTAGNSLQQISKILDDGNYLAKFSKCNAFGNAALGVVQVMEKANSFFPFFSTNDVTKCIFTSN